MPHVLLMKSRSILYTIRIVFTYQPTIVIDFIVGWQYQPTTTALAIAPSRPLSNQTLIKSSTPNLAISLKLYHDSCIYAYTHSSTWQWQWIYNTGKGPIKFGLGTLVVYTKLQDALHTYAGMDYNVKIREVKLYCCAGSVWEGISIMVLMAEYNGQKDWQICVEKGDCYVASLS